MTIRRALIQYPREQVTRRWLQKEELLLATVGLRVVGGIYRRTHITLIAVKAEI